MVRTYYNASNASKIYGGDSITSPRGQVVKDFCSFQQRKKPQVEREKIRFNTASEHHDKYPDYKKSWNRAKKSDVMPKNDWPHEVDTRRTMIPQFEEEKTFRPTCNTRESHRNYSGNGNLLNLMLKGSDEIDGFINSNRMFRGASAEKSRTRGDFTNERSPNANNRNNLINIGGFENQTLSNFKRKNRSMDLTSARPGLLYDEQNFVSPREELTKRNHNLFDLQSDQKTNRKSTRAQGHSKSIAGLGNLSGLRDAQRDSASKYRYGDQPNPRTYAQNYLDRDTSAKKRADLSMDFTARGSTHNNPVTGTSKRLRGEGYSQQKKVGVNGTVIRDERPPSTNRSIATIKRQKDLKGSDIFRMPTTGEQRDVFMGSRGVVPTRSHREKFQVTSPQVDAVAGIDFANKGRKLYFKESALNKVIKTDIFKQMETAKWPTRRDRTQNSVLSIDPFKSYFEIK